MKIYIHAFSSVKEILGFSKDEITVDKNISVEDVLQLLYRQYSELDKIKGKLMFALNEEYCNKKKELKEGDILAIFPPVSGG
ncbi:MAG: MoaD/ThiS family protein [Spirochaetes bacterium]|nr:MoaD/ThiS family protein [Spirochaetota bacterium]